MKSEFVFPFKTKGRKWLCKKQQWFLGDISSGNKKLPETSKITSKYKVGLGLSEIGEFENCSVVKHLFLA